MSQTFEKLKDGQIAHGDTRMLDSMTSTPFMKQDWERSCLVSLT